MNPVKAVYLLPLTKPIVIGDLTHEGSVFTACQKLVQGYVEIVYLTENDHEGWHLAAYVNEDGIGQGFSLNRQLCGYHLFGPVVIVRERIDREGETHYADVTEEDWQWIRKNDNMVIDVAALVNALSGN